MERTNLTRSLAEARAFYNLTQDELAAKLNVTRSAVSQWETGDTTPGGASRQLLALILEVPLDTVDSWFERQPVAVAS